MKRNFIVLLLLTFLAACAGTGLGGLEAPNVTLADLRPKGMTVFEQQYDIALRVQNPNNRPLAINGLNFSVDINGQEFARGVGREKTTIPALGDGIIHITVTSSTFDWLRQLDKLGRNDGKDLSYALKGSLFLDGMGMGRLPFTRSGTLNSLGKQ